MSIAIPALTLKDICCCAGLASDGYASVLGAGAVSGLDLEPQPDYPYPFTQADAIEWLAGGMPEPYDALHTSFPCQALTTAGHLRAAQGGQAKYPELLTPGLALLRSRWSHKLWVAENVDDNQGKARAIMAPRAGEYLITLCGSHFGLPVQRHRLFLANFPLRQPAPTNPRTVYGRLGCRHDTFPLGPKGKPKPIGVYHVPGDKVPEGGHTARDAEEGRKAMGSHRTLPWDKLKEGIPPAYAAWVAADLLRAHTVRAAA